MEPDDIPQEVVDAYTEAWEAKRKEIVNGVEAFGTKTRAGLSAALTKLDVKCVCYRCVHREGVSHGN